MRRFLTGTLIQMQDVRVAIDLAEGLPRRAIVVGGPDMLPMTHVPGVAGWTEHLCPEPVVADDGTAALEVPDEAVRHLGRRVRVGGRNVDLPAESERVLEDELPPDLRDRVRPKDSDQPGRTNERTSGIGRGGASR